jgi:hypothetical protein
MKMHDLTGHSVEQNRRVMTCVDIFEDPVFVIVTGDKKGNEFFTCSVGINKRIKLPDEQRKLNIMGEKRP